MINPLWCLCWLLYTGHRLHHTEFIKEFGDFLSELVLAADKVLIVGDFNIHVDNEKDALNSIGVRQHVSGPTHCQNHTLDLITSHGIDVNGVEILQQSDDISDHYLVMRVGYQRLNQTNQDSIRIWLKHEEPNSTNRRTRQRQDVVNQIPTSSPSEYSLTSKPL